MPRDTASGVVDNTTVHVPSMLFQRITHVLSWIITVGLVPLNAVRHWADGS